MSDELSLARTGRVPQITDVARLAGVSPATVSRTLSNPDIVSVKTRERVLEAVRAIGYTPNIAGRHLRAQRSHMVLVVVPNIANPFFSEVLRGIDETLSRNRYGIIIANLSGSAEKEARYVDLVLAGQVDGVLLLCGRFLRGRTRDLSGDDLPVVALCETIPGAEIPQIAVDNRQGAAEAVAHLVALGHRRLCYLTGPADNVLEVERSEGFDAGLRAAGLDPASAVRLTGDFTFQSGVVAARHFLALETRPSGVFASNDEMAIGFMKTVREGGIDVPGDLSIVGFDGIEFADFCEPTLTTVRQPRRAIGAEAATRLVAVMENGADSTPAIRPFATEFLVRASTARCRD